jgi:tetratricopeptide (TPR) repeat protein
MSLVNDVLRDLDGRRELPEHGLSFPGLINNHETKLKTPYKSILLFISFLLVVILTMQLIYKKPISQIFSTAIISNPDNEIELVYSDVLSFNTVPDVIDNHHIDSIDGMIEEEKIFEITVQRETVVRKEAVVEKEVVVEKEAVHQKLEKKTVTNIIPNVKKSPVLKLQKEHKHAVEIKKVSIAGDFNYQQSIKEYKQRRYEAALNSIESAINDSQDEKYQVFKARILLRLDDGVKFLTFIQQHPENSSLNWFQFVAPGLQLFSYYELSNQYYLRLIKKQPSNVKWPLAMALNYKNLNKVGKTREIYQTLLKSSLISMNQKKWITSQVHDLDKSLDNKEEHRYGS